MANLPISGLTASASNAAATDVLPVVQTTGTGPVKMTVQQMAGGLLGSTTISGATITADAPVLNLAQTWNNGAVTFTGLKFNATSTASASGSLLMDFQVGSVSAFNVSKGGSLKLGLNTSGTNAAASDVTISGSQGTGTGAGGNIIFQVAPAGGSGPSQNALATAFQVNGNGGITGQDGATANTLALRNSTSAQTFNVYNTFTNASNYERGALTWISNVLTLSAENAGTGSNRGISIIGKSNAIVESTLAAVFFRTSSTNRWSVDATGHFLAASDNAVDIGAASANRPRSVYAGTSITPGRGVAVASLPTPSTGMIARVTDALAPTVGTTVAGGGAAYALVNYNGANWTVIGV